MTAVPGPEGERFQLTTLSGWRYFASDLPAVPQLLDELVWRGLDEEKRAVYDDDRIDHHSRLLVVQTPAVGEVITQGRG